MFKLLDTKAFAELCKKVMRQQRILDGQLHELAVNAIGYSIIHGDVQPANRVIDAMQNSLRKDAMVAYLEKFGQVAWMKADKKFVFYKVEGITFDPEELLDGIKWHEAKKANEPVSQYDVEAAFDKFMKTVERTLKDGKVEVKNKELVQHLRNASAHYHATAHTQAKDGE